MSGAHSRAAGSAHEGRDGNASPTYFQLTRSVLTNIGIGWNSGAPAGAVSASLSGSVVQYMYQRRRSSPRPRSTAGSAQLSTTSPPATEGFSGLR
jgi:hypothetical protein